MKILLFIFCFLLTACSSPSDRAPVYDVKLEKGNLKGKSGAYVAGGTSVKKGQKQYIVKKGDTLYSISWRANMNVDTLIKYNNLRSPYLIRKGQVLQLQKTTPKEVLYSQKSNSMPCADKSCEQNHHSALVKKTTKEYSANKLEKKAIKQQNKVKSKVKEQKKVNNQIVNKKIIKSKTANNQSKTANNQNQTIKKKEVKRKIAKQQNIKKEATKEKDVKKKVTNWRWPSKGKLTKTFANSSQGMKGISISAARGTPIYAAAEGKVVYAGNGLRGYGNLIIIKHNYDYLSAYAHSDKIIIKENEHIKVGQKIAIMGDSGAEHVGLHFDIRYRGKSVDPLRYLPQR